MLGLGQHLSSLASASPRPSAASVTASANKSHVFSGNKHSEVGGNDGTDEVEGSPDGSWLGTSDVEASTKVEMNFLSL